MYFCIQMLLFLDIDGVMVPAKSWKPAELLNDGFLAFSDKATHVLQSIVTSDTTVILTTSHKSNFTIEEWGVIFRNRGLNIPNIRTLDKNVDNLNRREEIERWFINNNVNENFVILDDDSSLNDLPEYLKQKLVLTNTQIGLVESHIQTIIEVKSRVLDLVF